MQTLTVHHPLIAELFPTEGITPATHLLALIGYPLTHSKSDTKHNKVMAQLGFAGAYAKKPVLPEQLGDFLEAAKEAQFTGLSVTMPLKEAIIPYLDMIDPAAELIGAVNTVKIVGDKLYGFNTDAAGALRAVKEVMGDDLRNKRVVILGAGGVVKAIAHVLKRAGAELLILNRTVDRAQQLAKQFQCECGSSEQLQEALKACDLFVQCTPIGTDGVERSVSPSWLSPRITVFEVINQPTQLIEDGLRVGCPIVKGTDMWIYQAIEQYRIWFGDALDAQAVEAGFRAL